jgi:stage II sporulation protein R
MVQLQSSKKYILLLFVFSLLLMSWEINHSDAAAIEPVIPQDAIRLRILANSDSIVDQQMKRIVRDAIVAQMDKWVSGPHTINEAREVVRNHLPELEALIGETLQRYSYTYGYQIELATVPFPTKMYGDRVYPAGEYEALRVTLGQGDGQNWWCVLFPPLCFVDATTGEAVAVEKGTKAASSETNKGTTESPVATGKKETPNTIPSRTSEIEQSQPKKEIRFLLWNVIKSLLGSARNK